MIVEFDKSFEKSLRSVHDKRVFQRLKRIINLVEKAPDLSEVSNIVKLTGFTDYYRIRIGNYRVGFELINKTTVRFIIIAHRKDIYKLFP